MKTTILTLVLFLINIYVHGQETEGYFLKDQKTNCTIWFKHTFNEDSVTWSGNCKDNLASGQGTMIGFTKGKQTTKYVGNMMNGKPNGIGVFSFWENRKLSGNFLDGEPLFLNEECLNHLHKNIISKTDTNETYVGDNNLKDLYYHALIPEGRINGGIVLMPGTWETTEHVISSTQTFCELAYKNHLAVLVLSINQRLTLTDATIDLMNQMLKDAITRYQIPMNKIAIGGFSMGGLFSLRYTELSIQDSTKTTIKPKAVFSCDGPCDVENTFDLLSIKLKKQQNINEAIYGIAELKKYCGGTPDEARNNYIYYSCYSHKENDGGNAKYLLNLPVRIYNDVDINWWMTNRNIDLYSMNALDQSAMILFLNNKGNKQAEFINAYQKGYRIEGNRHPHSWSIIEPNDCLKWILNSIK